VVDASQGVEAQTVANCYTAHRAGRRGGAGAEQDRPAAADPENARTEIEDVIGIDATDAILCSAKTGLGVDDVLEAIVARMPPPKGDPDGAAEGADHRLLVRQLRRRGDAGARGRWQLRAKDKILLMSTGAQHLCEQVGVFTPKSVSARRCAPGEVGFIIAGIKELEAAKVGDTVTARRPAPPPSRCPASRKSSRRCSPACIRSSPTSTTACATRWKSSSSTTPRCTTSRKSRRRWASASAAASSACCTWRSCRSAWSASSTMDLITTAPTVVYEVLMRDGTTIQVENPAKLPEVQKMEEIREPIITTKIFVPQEYLGSVITLCEQKRGQQVNMAYHGRQVQLTYDMPMAEVVMDFFDKLKSVSRGYASLDYEFKEYRAADVVKLDVLINGDKVDALSLIVHRANAPYRGRELAPRCAS
jgi:GTP-binding protein LepA